MWKALGKEKRKCEIIVAKQAENILEEEIMEFLQNNPDQLLCQECNGQCLPKSPYKLFSKSRSMCRSALLCKEVRVPPLDLPWLNINFCPEPGRTDVFKIMWL